ncbi:MAG TPA: fimbria/pilus periplasmic chaperone [Kofleriaceae bacterium]|jgi:fimbrial chaperone protein
MRALVVALVLASAGAAHAQAQFAVDRTRIDLTDAGPTGALTITNHGHAALRLSLAAFSWHDDIDGAMQLQPTTDIVVRPALIEIAPGTSRVVRIGTTVRPGSAEASFRVFAEELPSRVPEASNTIAVRTRVGIPVFVAPRGSASIGALSPVVALDGGKAVVTVQGVGALHAKLATITVKAIANGKVRWSHDVGGWYVLPGQTRRFPVALGTDSCAGADQLVAEIVGEDNTRWLGPPLRCH